jgi:hypothetical protein
MRGGIIEGEEEHVLAWLFPNEWELSVDDSFNYKEDLERAITEHGVDEFIEHYQYLFPGIRRYRGLDPSTIPMYDSLEGHISLYDLYVPPNIIKWWNMEQVFEAPTGCIILQCYNAGLVRIDDEGFWYLKSSTTEYFVLCSTEGYYAYPA